MKMSGDFSVSNGIQDVKPCKDGWIINTWDELIHVTPSGASKIIQSQVPSRYVVTNSDEIFTVRMNGSSEEYRSDYLSEKSNLRKVGGGMVHENATVCPSGNFYQNDEGTCYREDTTGKVSMLQLQIHPFQFGDPVVQVDCQDDYFSIAQNCGNIIFRVSSGGSTYGRVYLTGGGESILGFYKDKAVTETDSGEMSYDGRVCKFADCPGTFPAGCGFSSHYFYSISESDAQDWCQVQFIDINTFRHHITLQLPCNLYGVSVSGGNVLFYWEKKFVIVSDM